MDEILNFKMQIAFTSPDLKVNKFTKQFRVQIVITSTIDDTFKSRVQWMRYLISKCKLRSQVQI